MPWYLQMKGADELNKNIEKLVKGLSPDVVEPILADAAQTIADDARSRVKVKTGNLKRGIVDKTLQRKGDRTAAMAGINYGRAPHAHLVEFGHGGKHPAPAHPFFRPAWDSNKERIQNDIEDGLRDAVKDAV